MSHHTRAKGEKMKDSMRRSVNRMVIASIFTAICLSMVPTATVAAQDTLHVTGDLIGIGTSTPGAALEARDDQ